MYILELFFKYCTYCGKAICTVGYIKLSKKVISSPLKQE